jgi:hypothetical protein
LKALILDARTHRGGVREVSVRRVLEKGDD